MTITLTPDEAHAVRIALGRMANEIEADVQADKLGTHFRVEADKFRKLAARFNPNTWESIC